MNINEFLLARTAEDEVWAREASRSDILAQGDLSGGVHWHWVDPATDKPITLDPTIARPTDTQDVALRSVEEWRSLTGLWDLPQLALSRVDEVTTTVAGHIARWDPARVLAECEAKRARIELHTVDHRENDTVCYRCMVNCDVQWGSSVAQYEDWPCTPLRLEAAPYKDHPDFDPSWS